MAISKQDLCGARTAADIERKYNFGKSFSEVMGFAEQAQRSAEAAQSAVKTLNENLSQEEIFNRLTNNGEAEGIFRDEDGNIYINAEYINFDELNGKNITMTGAFKNVVSTYIPPSREESTAIAEHITGVKLIPAYDWPKYDFNGDGAITIDDLFIAGHYQSGLEDFSQWSGAVATTVTMTIDMSNPLKAVHLTGTNMWGRNIDEYIGINGISLKNAEMADNIKDIYTQIAVLETRIAALENA